MKWISLFFVLFPSVVFAGWSGKVSGVGSVDPRKGKAALYYLEPLKDLMPDKGPYYGTWSQPIRYLVVGPPSPSGDPGHLMADFTVVGSPSNTGDYALPVSLLGDYFFAPGCFFGKFKSTSNSPNWAMFSPVFYGYRELEISGLRLEMRTERNRAENGFGSWNSWQWNFPMGAGIGGSPKLYLWNYTSPDWPAKAPSAVDNYVYSWGGPLTGLNKKPLKASSATQTDYYAFPTESNFAGWSVGAYTALGAGSGDGHRPGHAGVVRIFFDGSESRGLELTGSLVPEGAYLSGYAGNLEVDFKLKVESK
jgi:hypothetical protein